MVRRHRHWTHEETAKRFAAIGLDIGSNHYELRLMSVTTTHVSVFALVEFPEEALFTKLSEYGDFHRCKTWHLTFKDAGFPHILTGVRVIQFTKMRKHIPGNMTTEHDNWKPKLEKLEKCLNLWKLRSLSLVGKTVIINLLGASKIGRRGWCSWG